MLPWIISHDLMRTNEEEPVRATRYAHHRAHTYRRPGPFLAALLQAGMSRVPVPRRGHTALADLTPTTGDTLRLTVSDLGRITPIDPTLGSEAVECGRHAHEPGRVELRYD